MELITAIEPTKRGRLSVYLNGDYYCVLHPDVYYAAGLHAGQMLEVDDLEELRRESELKITKERALRLLGQRSYTEKGLYDKLKAYTDEDIAQAAVDRMCELGLIDDLDYARRYASDCYHLKGFSSRRTEQELCRKGVDRDVARQVLEEMDYQPERAIARLIRRKYLRQLAEEKGKQRAVNALLRMGYGYSEIRTTISNLLEDESYYGED